MISLHTRPNSLPVFKVIWLCFILDKCLSVKSQTQGRTGIGHTLPLQVPEHALWALLQESTYPSLSFPRTLLSTSVASFFSSFIFFSFLFCSFLFSFFFFLSPLLKFFGSSFLFYFPLPSFLLPSFQFPSLFAYICNDFSLMCWKWPFYFAQVVTHLQGNFSEIHF